MGEINQAKEAATPIAPVRRPAPPKRVLETVETPSLERRKSVRLADQDAINVAKEESLNELVERVDTDPESEEDLTCRENGCMESFWYMSELLDHMKSVHIM